MLTLPKDFFDLFNAAVTATNQIVDQLNRNELGIPERPIVKFMEGKWIDGPSVPHKLPQRESASTSRKI